MPAAALVHQPVAGEERQRPSSQAERYRIGATAAKRFVGELERQRADEHTGTERHHQPDRPLTRADLDADDGADQKRRPADQAPKRRLEHQTSLPEEPRYAHPDRAPCAASGLGVRSAMTRHRRRNDAAHRPRPDALGDGPARARRAQPAQPATFTRRPPARARARPRWSGRATQAARAGVPARGPSPWPRASRRSRGRRGRRAGRPRS